MVIKSTTEKPKKWEENEPQKIISENQLKFMLHLVCSSHFPFFVRVVSILVRFLYELLMRVKIRENTTEADNAAMKCRTINDLLFDFLRCRTLQMNICSCEWKQNENWIYSQTCGGFDKSERSKTKTGKNSSNGNFFCHFSADKCC